MLLILILINAININSDTGEQSKLVMMPSEKLANMQCDFMEEIWEGMSTGQLNWSGEPLTIEAGEVIGNMDQVSRVSPEDPIWSSPEVTVTQISQLSNKDVLRCTKRQL